MLTQMRSPSDYISSRALAVDASGIRKVFDLAAKMKDPINLSIGLPDFDVPEVARHRVHFDNLTPYYPTQKLNLEVSGQKDMSTRIMEEARERVLAGWCQGAIARDASGRSVLPRARKLAVGRSSVLCSRAGTANGPPTS